jgi:hypothetical protein
LDTATDVGCEGNVSHQLRQAEAQRWTLIRIIKNVESGGGQWAASFQVSEWNGFLMTWCVVLHGLRDDRIRITEPDIAQSTIHG